MPSRVIVALVAFVTATVAAAGQQTPPAGQQPPPGKDDAARFRGGVELINVTATVSDASGRFVPGLTQDDFEVLEDGVPQAVVYFSNERVPVSLGIAIDTSGSMEGEKIQSARDALSRFLGDLLDPSDEIFLYRFSEIPILLQPWTTDRGRLKRALWGMSAHGGTALYDTVAETLPLVRVGRRQKKALLVISDGNDTSSQTRPAELRQMVRDSELLVYAIGIDATERTDWTRGRTQPRFPVPRPPFPFPIPPGSGPRTPTWPPGGYPPGGGGGGNPPWSRGSERANIVALRELTNDSGGRTEVVRAARDLDPATASIADELSKQYLLAYQSPQLKDGRWHTIDVRLKQSSYRVRARRGYTATP
jgi:Ca-activated chloride channel family protein